jgi:hypothetical protein
MIRQIIREHDGDCYIVKMPDNDEIQCGCDRILPKEKAIRCEICNNLFCPDCGIKDYKGNGWFICSNCQSNPELIIDTLIKQL